MAKPKPSAHRQMMDYLSRRDHSESELRSKLERKFATEDVDAAIDHAKKHHWIPSTEADQKALSLKVAETLHRKKKGILFINSFLQEKGMAEVESDSQQELEKALDLVKTKYRELSRELSSEERLKLKGKLARFLAARGFEPDIVGRLLKKVIPRP